MTSSPFFDQLFPQSEYRRGKKRESGTKSTALVTALSSLSSIDPALQQDLKDRIEAEVDLIFNTLLPNTVWNPKEKHEVYVDILTSLGLHS